jgi:hypothetical protein
MNLWFDREYQEQKLLGYMPKGSAYKQSFVKNTNFNNFLIWIATSFRWLVDEYNQTFKGNYICESDYLIDNWKKDYSIPGSNDVFLVSEEDNRADVFVLKYLMRGNTRWNFQAIANIYGIEVSVENGIDYFIDSRLPHKIPHEIVSFSGEITEVLVITFLGLEFDILPHDVPHILGTGARVEKIKKIYDIIKEAQCKIIYTGHSHKELEDKIEFCKQVNL